MAAAVLFDTLDYARKLETAGVPAPQAEAQARVLADVLGHAIATSDDLRVVETNLGSRLSAVEAQLRAAVTRLEAKIEAVQSGLEARIATVQSGLETRIAAVEARVATVESRLDAKIDAVRTELVARIDKLAASVDTIKWLFGLLAATNLAMLVRSFVHP